MAVAIASLLIIALTVFVGRSFTISREQFEQVRITEDARLELERISDALRNARYVDRNNNGVTSDPQEGWLLAGGANSIAVFTNIDADSDAELVRYFVDSAAATELKRGVTQLQGTTVTGSEQVTTLSRSLRNIEQAQPLFTYYAQNNAIIPAPVSAGNLAAVARVGLALAVDASPAQKPDAAFIATDVAPRTTSCTTGACQAGAACVPKPGTPVGPFPYSSNSFIEDGGQACKAHCATPGVTEACPWGSSFSWDGANTVTGYCTCGTPTFPSPLPDIRTYGQYTSYYKEKWEFCNAQGQQGQAVCNPGYELNPGSTGECAYGCGPSPLPSPPNSSASPTPSQEASTPPPIIINYKISGSGNHIHAPSTHGCYTHGHILEWHVQNAASCTASGVWDGPKPTLGTEVFPAQNNGLFTLTCSGPGGQVSGTVSMTTDQFVGCS